MTDRKRLYCLLLIMGTVAAVVGGIAILGLYRAALRDTGKRLQETAEGHRRLIGAMYRFDSQHASQFASGARAATMQKVLDAHKKKAGFGKTGEFVLARRDEDKIVIVLSRKRSPGFGPASIPFDSDRAEPMRRALGGEAGTLVGLDYRGKTVLAAYEPVEELGLGIVAKIDLAEVRAPFVAAALVAGLPAIAVVLAGSWLFMRVSSPLLEHIKERDARLLGVLEGAVEAIITIDGQGRIESLNKSVETMFGYAPEELIGSNVRVLMPEPYCSEHDGYLQRYLETGERKIIGIGRIAEAVRKNGEVIPIDISVSEVEFGDRRIFTGIIRDITDRMRAEEQIRQSQRLAAIGQMVTGLAHESRNALQRAQACTEMLALDLEGDDEKLDLVMRTQRALEDLERLYEEVRGFATPIQLELQAGDLESVVSQTWTHLRQHAESARVSLHHAAIEIDTKAVFDRHRIGQVIRNIFENAIEAAREGGAVQVSYATTQLIGKSAVEVRIRDSGPGIAASQAEHVFEPFFTTKTKGTGLGMAIAKRIVEMHGGHIALANPDQHGAEFVVTLPREP